jgi:hypothetical protein
MAKKHQFTLLFLAATISLSLITALPPPGIENTKWLAFIKLAAISDTAVFSTSHSTSSLAASSCVNGVPLSETDE